MDPYIEQIHLFGGGFEHWVVNPRRWSHTWSSWAPRWEVEGEEFVLFSYETEAGARVRAGKLALHEFITQAWGRSLRDAGYRRCSGCEVWMKDSPCDSCVREEAYAEAAEAGECFRSMFGR